MPSLILSLAACATMAIAALTMHAVAQEGGRKPLPPEAPQPAADAYILGFTVKSIEGEEVDLSTYKGKVVVITNVASKCGFTPQYEGLQKLYEKHKDDGLVILGFPSNDFKEQEPGTNEEIAAFCKERFGVTFPLFAKISVKGTDQHPLYQKLAGQPEPIGGEPKWNFTKFVVDRQGNVVARFDAERAYIRSPELEPGLVAKVQELLRQQ